MAVVSGVPSLYGAKVDTTDLRGGAALIIGALSANDETVITDTGHIARGYENITDNLRSIGAQIKRCENDRQTETDSTKKDG